MRNVQWLRWSLIVLVSLTVGPVVLGQEDVPPTLRVPEGTKLKFTAEGHGVQVYTCDAAGAWRFVAPAATLYDADGNVIGTHYAGPTWELNNGSFVVGAVAARVENPGSIALLLLGAVANADFGKMKNVTYIQRLSTTGGLAPAGTCTAGDTAEVPYSAVYYFYKGHP